MIIDSTGWEQEIARDRARNKLTIIMDGYELHMLKTNEDAKRLFVESLLEELGLDDKKEGL